MIDFVSKLSGILNLLHYYLPNFIRILYLISQGTTARNEIKLSAGFLAIMCDMLAGVGVVLYSYKL